MYSRKNWFVHLSITQINIKFLFSLVSISLPWILTVGINSFWVLILGFLIVDFYFWLYSSCQRFGFFRGGSKTTVTLPLFSVNYFSAKNEFVTAGDVLRFNDLVLQFWHWPKYLKLERDVWFEIWSFTIQFFHAQKHAL